MCPCCLSPSLWLSNSGSCNHTHFQILSISTNVAHLSKGWKEHGERRRCAAKEVGREQWKRKMNKRLRRNDLAKPALPFSSPSTSFSLYTSNRYYVFVWVCVSGQVCGCFKASVQKAQINPTAYVFRNYHVYWLVFIVCVSLCMLLAVRASPAVIRSLGTAPPVCLCSFSIIAQSTGNKDKNGTVTELL